MSTYTCVAEFITVLFQRSVNTHRLRRLMANLSHMDSISSTKVTRSCKIQTHLYTHGVLNEGQTHGGGVIDTPQRWHTGVVQTHLYTHGVLNEGQTHGGGVIDTPQTWHTGVVQTHFPAGTGPMCDIIY